MEPPLLIGLLCCCLPIILLVITYSGSSSRRSQFEAKEKARSRALEMSEVDTMNGHAFEHYVARLLNNEGFAKVTVTQGSGDYGVDILASKEDNRYAIQVKRQSTVVSRRAISDAVAGKSHYGCDLAMVVTNSRMSNQSESFAESTGCIIVDRDTLSEWILRYQHNETNQT